MKKTGLRLRSLLRKLQWPFCGGTCKLSVFNRSSSLCSFPGHSTGMWTLSISINYL